MKKKPETKEVPPVWAITQKNIDTVTKVEQVYGTTRLLPPWDDIPKEFWDGNIYTRIGEAMFYGEKIPNGEVSFNEGFKQDPHGLTRCIMAHLVSFDPKHEHKIAGVGYMISKIVTVIPILT